MQYLLDIVTSFQNLTVHALSANYSSTNAFEDNPALKLATKIVNRDGKFSEDLSHWGHTFNFKRASPGQTDWSGGTLQDGKTKIPHLPSRKVKDIVDIQDILPESPKVAAPLSHDVYSWIADEHRNSRGFEIGTFNYVLLSSLMKKQSLKWTSLANGYIGDVITIVHEYIVKGLSQVCIDRNVYESLLSFLTDRLLDRYQTAIERVGFILSVERSMTPMTQNHYLNDTLEKW